MPGESKSGDCFRSRSSRHISRGLSRFRKRRELMADAGNAKVSKVCDLKPYVRLILDGLKQHAAMLPALNVRVMMRSVRVSCFQREYGQSR
jgi:hypothetical protein